MSIAVAELAPNCLTTGIGRLNARAAAEARQLAGDQHQHLGHYPAADREIGRAQAEDHHHDGHGEDQGRQRRERNGELGFRCARAVKPKNA